MPRRSPTPWSVARSNVSNSLRELQNSTSCASCTCSAIAATTSRPRKDVWELFRTVVRERKSREFDPDRRRARATASPIPLSPREDADTQTRIRETLALMASLSVLGRGNAAARTGDADEGDEARQPHPEADARRRSDLSPASPPAALPACAGRRRTCGCRRRASRWPSRLRCAASGTRLR